MTACPVTGPEPIGSTVTRPLRSPGHDVAAAGEGPSIEASGDLLALAVQRTFESEHQLPPTAEKDSQPMSLISSPASHEPTAGNSAAADPATGAQQTVLDCGQYRVPRRTFRDRGWAGRTGHRKQ